MKSLTFNENISAKTNNKILRNNKTNRKNPLQIDNYELRYHAIFLISYFQIFPKHD